MRFGWLTALVVGLLAAVPAQAAKFVQYSISAHGIVADRDANTNPLGTSYESDFVVTFALDVERNSPDDPNWTGEYISDGSYFFAPFNGDNYTMRIANGVLTASDYSDYGPHVLTNNSTLTLYLDPSIQTFAEILSGPATGAANISFGGHYDSHDFSGTISSIRTSSASTFAGIYAYAVPEPTTWMLMIAGFGLVGHSQRRRQRTASART